MNVDHSKIGKKSRRKGKSFERQLAIMFREWTGNDTWSTSRNSGRTDLPGDIHDMKMGVRLKACIEGKHRKSWEIRQLINETLSYMNEYDKVVRGWDDRKEEYPVLLMFCKNSLGLWVTSKKAAEKVSDSPHRKAFRSDAHIKSKSGILWSRVMGVVSKEAINSVTYF